MFHGTHLSDPRDRGDILLLPLPLAELDNTSVSSIPNINPRCQGNLKILFISSCFSDDASYSNMIETAPIHEVEIEVVEHVRCIKDLFRSVNNCPGVSRPLNINCEV